MTNEYLEALDRLYCEGDLEQHKKDYEFLKNALAELKAIKEAKPSEALEIIRKCKSSNLLNFWCPKIVEDLKIVENYILKAQEQEKVLEILKPDLRLVGNFLQARMPLVEDNDRWIIVKEITDEEELESLKKILGQTQI